jgi:hypothetical protein
MDGNLACVDAVNPYTLDVESGLQSHFDFNIFNNVGLDDSLDTFVTLEPPDPRLDVANIGSSNLPVIATEHIRIGPVSPVSLPWKPPKTLGQRSVDTPRAQMATMMLAQMIASFPYMMMRKETFPPFIHPRCYDYSRSSNELPEMLKDCMGLAHMFHSKKRESNKVFWRSVRMEQEKLYTQVYSA